MTPPYRYDTLVVGPLETNCYRLHSPVNNACLIIDPGGDPDLIIDAIERDGMKPSGIFLTHGHIDHCGAVSSLIRRYPVPTIMSEKDLPILRGAENQTLAHGFSLEVPETVDLLIREDSFQIRYFEDITIISTPGHTPGSLCLKTARLLFCGDTVFAGSIGRTDLKGGSYETILESIRKIKNLSEDLILLPGHGPKTDLKTEVQTNPFF